MFGKLFNNLKNGLTKTKNVLTDKINETLKLAITIDEDLYEELEEILIMADIGMDTTVEIIDRLKDKIRKEKINDVELVRPALKEVILEIMTENDNEKEETFVSKKEVMLVIGVNGVGKTTSIGKLAAKNKAEGKKVLLAAADTFRAGAIDQLVVWSERANVDIVKHEEGSDPAAVVFDAINASKSRNVDLLICDTAGRLHNKKNLMDELGKINRIIDRELSDAKKETLLVLDATSMALTFSLDNSFIHSLVTQFSVKSLLFNNISLGLFPQSFSISGLAELLGILASLISIIASTSFKFSLISL